MAECLILHLIGQRQPPIGLLHAAAAARLVRLRPETVRSEFNNLRIKRIAMTDEHNLKYLEHVWLAKPETAR